jgi:hypothetical protein
LHGAEILLHAIENFPIGITNPLRTSEDLFRAFRTS